MGIETFLEQNQLLVLIAIIMLGYTLGYIKIKGVSLGASACLFVAVAAGWLGARLPHIITMPIVILGIAITTITMIVSTFLAKKFLGLSTKSSMGITCGTMTSTPALGIMIKTLNDESPVIAYASVYPVAAIILTVLGNVLVWAVYAFI